MATLMHDLGFRPPCADETARIDVRRARENDEQASGPVPAFLIPSAILSGDPLISYSGIVPNAPLGLASIGGERLRKRTAWFLLSPTWSIEDEGIAANLRAHAVVHRLGNPNHRIIFVCNTPREVGYMQGCNEAAILYNKTANTLESIFKPLDGIPVEFDAIYNAQLALWKRHELSVEIRNCAFLCYRDPSAPGSAAMQEAILSRHAVIPGHVFVNAFGEDELPVQLSRSEVNWHLNRAGIGLCLSEKEGAMFASTEYLLSGLPIVTTPSVGGRDVYHDAEYCWTASPDPRSVADAVYALKAKGISSIYIRERTLRRLEADRERFLALLDAILEECGSKRRLAGPWPFRKEVTMQWHSTSDAVNRAYYRLVDGFDRREGGFLPWRLRRKFVDLRRRFTAFGW